MQAGINIKRLVFFFGFFLVLGSFFYILIGYNVWLAFYTTLIIMLSHFKHGVEYSTQEQIVDIVLIIGSYFVFAYMIKGAAEYLFEGEFAEKRRRKKMKNKIDQMKEHFIVAGFGRVGKQIAQDLKDEEAKFVIIDRDADAVHEALGLGYLAVEGDPIKEESLKMANIKKAKCLLAALGKDSDNLFLSLTAKSLNPELFVVARASLEENVDKLIKAGADRVSLPYKIGGYHMAGIALRPAVVDFLDVITDGKRAELQVEEINIERGTNLVGGKIIDFFSRQKNGITVLALNRLNGETLISPSGEEVINRNDQLIVMGTRAQLEKALKDIG